MKTFEMKAEPFTESQLERWLSGKIPRRHLALPFGGPLSSPHYAKGMDIEREFFHEGTDFYGPYPWLRQSKDRLVDWHHVTFGDRTDPTGVMKGAILGKIVLDDEPSSEDIDGIPLAGVWSDFWINAGERKRQLVAMLARKDVPLYGSSQPVQKAIDIDPVTGAINVWPVRFHTMTTSPTNTNAVMAPMKALLDDPFMADLSVGALRAYLTGADDLGSDLLSIAAGDGLPGKGGAKAGQVLSAVNETDIEDALARMLDSIERLQTVISRSRGVSASA